MSMVLSALGGALPDERPLLSLQIVESVAKCPAGYVPVSRTYDEDADAGLLKQNGLFGKKPSHYICLSKSEGVWMCCMTLGMSNLQLLPLLDRSACINIDSLLISPVGSSVPGYVMDGVVVVGEREPAPAGYSVAGRAGKRRLCTRVSRHAAAAPPHAARAPPITDVIVCSRMRQAPDGFLLAGEINGKVVCYKVSGGSADSSPAHAHTDYENVVSNVTPDAQRRARQVPERPPKLSPLISELNQLNIQSGGGAYPHIEQFTSEHDYEALSPSYNIKPCRPAPRPPSAVSPTRAPSATSPGGAPAAARRKAPAPAPVPRSNYQTLGGYSGMEGVPFLLNPKLRGLPADTMTQLPSIKRRTRFELDRDYSYNFTVERQT